MIIKTSPDEIQNYLTDASNLKGFCDAVYFPENESDVVEILKEANEKKIKVTVSGSGTGLTGARVPNGGIVIATDKLNRVIEINEKDKTATVEPGVILSDFQNLVNEKKLMYPPDPTERNCFIGGTVATNASGEKTFKYGPTRNYVLELNVVLANGELLKLKRGDLFAYNYSLRLKTESGSEYDLHLPDYSMPLTKNASGYFSQKNMDAIDLFIGSEGTLGVVTQIKLKLVDKPDKILSCVMFFNLETDALSFINQARKISYQTRQKELRDALDALALEFFDKNSLNFLFIDYPNVPLNAEAAVWFEQEVNIQNEEFLIEEWMKLISEFNGNEESAWFAFSDSDNKKIQNFRHAISWKISEYISQNNLKKLGTDVAVPDDKFEELYFFSKSEVEKENLPYVVYGHFGNSHMHLNMLPKSEEDYLKGKEVYKRICTRAVELGGTISAEHGIGKLKTDYLVLMYGEANIRKMAEVKKVLDPNLILGSGNIFK
ncbi:MAG: dehydrogenase [Ignavibacteria bacterium RIFOXYB2_FULL_35_12]|nr:MAG: dehydrogenase [Ignavibacteria bacterium GWC2_35_8]OGU60176.1 MAG: dehydrogenase [Ignavibacteria bacterium GWF2_35_20]OGU82510.1 MAG: dehydrogenase [Ignavibacteria bacterium RIFOXYA2_FULL_35_9]OGU84047.1 MAG: dehydrogenase [Ignavibacteria bacterium RIFOXYA12_FULL_35_25]OGU88591.1 MAG: dehydrogenase [Ignavibacteria bacterium RIFOXYC12_FULL_35_11]OGU94948.1 MAG: dehydrogenase [Ignavibacteria bacterium RIFOXYB12_FULL_35_14]OGU98758.1 MAG: dehydrogenase [Ignavibacteria bacterium RIFOXYC2_F